jgi:Tfp pilus assembly protein PilF
LQIEPHYAEAHYNLANALQRQGKVVEAVAHYRHALRVRPDLAGAHNNLGIALYKLAAAHAEAGRFGEAIRTASQAIHEATAAGNEELADQARRQIERYRRGLP